MELRERIVTSAFSSSESSKFSSPVNVKSGWAGSFFDSSWSTMSSVAPSVTVSSPLFDPSSAGSALSVFIFDVPDFFFLSLLPDFPPKTLLWALPTSKRDRPYRNKISAFSGFVSPLSSAYNIMLALKVDRMWCRIPASLMPGHISLRRLHSSCARIAMYPLRIDLLESP